MKPPRGWPKAKGLCTWCMEMATIVEETWEPTGETYHRCCTCSRIIEHRGAPGNGKVAA